MFGKRQRRYMLAYLGIEHAKMQHSNDALRSEDGQEINLPPMSCQLIENLVKKFREPSKTHRNIIDQDKSFIEHVVKWMRTNEGPV